MSEETKYEIEDLSPKGERLRSVIEKLRNRSDFTTFIYFRVNNLELDTRDPSPNKQYVVSLTNEKNGSGYANSFSLTVTFTNYDTKTIKEFEDSFIMTDNIGKKDKNLCRLKYGYVRTAEGEEELSTPEYEGRLLDFKMNIRDNFISYTFTGYSGLKAEQDVLVQWYPGEDLLKEYKDKTTYTSYIESCLIGGDPLIILNKFLEDLTKLPDTFNYHLKLLDSEIAESGALSKIAVSPCNSKSPVTYINYLLSMFKYNQRLVRDSWISSLSGITPTVSYTIEMTGKDDYTIYLYLRRKRDPIATFSLNSGNPATNDLMIDFNVNVDGSVVLAIDQSEKVKEKSSQVIQANGKVVEVASTFNVLARSARTSVNQNVFESNIKSNKFDFCQTGDATLIGIPAEIPISTTIELVNYLNNERHRVSGKFFVESTTDSISTGGFFTTKVECLRLEDESDELKFNKKGD